MIYDILFYVGLTILWIYSEPSIELKRFIGFKEEEYMNYSKIKKWIHKLIYCGFCSGFWIGLTYSFEMAVLTSLGMWILENKLK